MTPEVQAGLLTLVALVTGLMLGTARDLFVRRQERVELARQVARAISGEIKGLVHIGEVHGYVGFLRTTADRIEQGEQIAAKIPAQLNYFQVYEANASHLGLLSDSLPGDVARFYVRAKSVYEDFRSMSDVSTIDPEEDARYLRGVADSISDTMALGKTTAEALDQFARAK